MLTMLVIAVLVGAPIGAYFRWPESRYGRAVRAVWDRLAAKAAEFVGDPPLPETVPSAPPRPAATVPPRGARAPLPDLPAGKGPGTRAKVTTAGAAAQGVPPEYLPLITVILEYIPEDDADLQAWYLDHAAGIFALGEAWFGNVESLLNDVGIDPVFAQSALTAGEAVSDMAEVFANLAARLVQVYALLKEHKAGDGTFPDDPNFITPDVL